MELHQLRAFLAVRDTGSATGAAARLSLRQSTVSAAVRALESSLGVQLFHRAGRGMTPTPAGRALVGPARRILRDVAQADDGADDARSHRLDLAALGTVTEGPFTALVASWLGDHAARSVRIRGIEREDQAADLLLSGAAEVLCSRLPPPFAMDEHLSVVPIGSWEWRVAFPPGAADVPEGAVSMTDLREQPMLLVPPGRQSALERATVRTPLRPAVVADQREARTSLMRAGVGATIVGPTLAEDALLLGCEVRPFTPPFEQAAGLVFDRDALSSVALTFVETAERRAAAGH